MGTKIAPGPNTVKGIDVSNWQPTVDFQKVKAAGYEFVFLKASEGLTFRDKSFQRHAEAAQAAGMIVGAYHFFHPTLSAEGQAENFLEATKILGPQALPLVLDVEWADGLRGLNEAQAQNTLACLEALEKAEGETPIIYTANGFFGSAPGQGRFSRFPLWIANYGTPAPTVPSAWNSWMFWQYSDKQYVPGAGNIDANLFNGTLAQLRDFAAKGSGDPVPTDQGITFAPGVTRNLQIAANATGYLPRLKEDDIPGPKTRAALIAIAEMMPSK